jgi:hypothetical protein
MSLRPLNDWLPQTLGLLASACIAILSTTAPRLPYTWPRLLLASAILTLLTIAACAAAMFLTYIALPKPCPGPIISRTSATAACFVPLLILLEQNSLWAPIAAAFLIWTILPPNVNPKPQWKKFSGAMLAAVLLQIAVAAALGEQPLIAALTLGFASAPVLWRIRQERPLRGPFRPRITITIAALLAILSLTHYLPSGNSATSEAYAKIPGNGKKVNGAAPGISVGGKYRGVILSPEEEPHTILVPPIPMMGRNPFLKHKDPLGIPFYGVYWFFQAPDKAPNQDAYRVKGSPDTMAFRSADMSPLKMEAHQNLGRLIDIKSCSRIDVVIRNADTISGSLAMELVLINTSDHFFQWLGQVPVKSQPVSQETLSFKIPPSPAIQQFDELTIRFLTAKYRATRSPRIAITRFYLIPRHQGN